MTGRCRVVLADDSHDFREVLRRVLERDGRFEVVAEAADGDAAVDTVDREHPDLLVLDISMPGRPGSAVVPLVRERSPATRVVVLSAYVTAPELAADAELDKNAGLDRIVATLARVGEVPAVHNP